MDSKSPINTLTVVIILLQGREKLTRCLNTLANQEAAPIIDIIVPFDDSYPDVVSLESDFPAVQFISVPGQHTYAELRTVGVKQANGRIVAITEDHCIPAPQWAAEIMKAHEREVTAVGGPVDKATPDSALNWSLYFADYVRYANPMPAGETHHLTDCNVTYKLDKLQTIASVWQDEFHEPEVHGAIEAQAGKLWFSPGVLVEQQRSITLGDAVRDRYTFGRLFGGRRAMTASLGQRLAYLLISLLLPLLLILRIAQNVFGKGRYKSEFFRSLLHIILLSFMWALGEFIGYLTGNAGEALTPDEQATAVD
ncbi:MAG: glycosyltransferase family 2 protein [Chloroflexi bacterium]|nr:glycosyltransferase family 2 protein [Chloroflexota bacterium]